MTYTYTILTFLAQLLLFAIGVGIIAIIVMYIIDRRQTAHAIRRNYPVIGRFRYFFEHIGEFFRQYFFAMDREELPFNRAQRNWIYRAAKNIDQTIAFGSTRDITKVGSLLFLNSAFPTLKENAVEPKHVTIGPSTQHPYSTNSLVNVSAMSYGSLSKPAIIALSKGAASAGCWLNTGEGGLAEAHLVGGCDVIFQIGTAKYGVRDSDGNLCDKELEKIAAYTQVKMFELKLSQGAKPGKGGMLPAGKINVEIARIRGIPENEDSMSPNAHPEIQCPADLLDMIARIRRVTGKPTGFKCVLGDTEWINQLCQDILDRGIESAPDFITLDSADGGTGAAPQPLMDYVGLPIKESLPWLIDTLEAYGLKDRIKVIASGKLVTPAAVGWAIAVGADFVNTARGFMFSLGCIQALQCNQNTCPTGVTTHDPELQRGLVPAEKSKRVANYHKNISYELGTIAHSCGAKSPRELNRSHIRMVLANGLSKTLDEIYPKPEIIVKEP